MAARAASEQHVHRHGHRADRPEEGRMYTSVTPHPVVPEAGAELRGLARLWHQLGPGSGRRHARARADAQRLVGLRYRWQEACQHVGLGIMVYTPSGVVVSAPRVARADFGEPVSFTVELRPGQSAADLRNAERRLSRALHVVGLRIVERDGPWVNVEVIGPDDGLGHGDDGDSPGPDRDDQPQPPALRVA
jgi:hypothetical protein